MFQSLWWPMCKFYKQKFGQYIQRPRNEVTKIDCIKCTELALKLHYMSKSMIAGQFFTTEYRLFKCLHYKNRRIRKFDEEEMKHWT